MPKERSFSRSDERVTTETEQKTDIALSAIPSQAARRGSRRRVQPIGPSENGRTGRESRAWQRGSVLLI